MYSCFASGLGFIRPLLGLIDVHLSCILQILLNVSYHSEKDGEIERPSCTVRLIEVVIKRCLDYVRLSYINSVLLQNSCYECDKSFMLTVNLTQAAFI